ncbi:MAG: hypothetical protein H0W81_12170 [Chloroflexi bacterium]|nr:hypothetical protein [Chloroflexota bacterium]
MEWLFSDPPPIAWPIAGLTVSGLVLAAALTARWRAARLEGTVLEVFWRDVATMGRTLAGVMAAPSLAAIVPIEGLGQPLWIVVGAAAVVVAAALLLIRWRSQELGKATRQAPVTPTGAPQRRLISTGWEIGMLGAGGAGLLTYLVSAGHAFGHPIHWLIAALGLFIGYAFGIGAVTPRFTLESPSARRT